MCVCTGGRPWRNFQRFDDNRVMKGGALSLLSPLARSRVGGAGKRVEITSASLGKTERRLPNAEELPDKTLMDPFWEGRLDPNIISRVNALTPSHAPRSTPAYGILDPSIAAATAAIAPLTSSSVTASTAARSGTTISGDRGPGG